MEHEILNGLRIKVVGDIGRKGRKSREPVDEVDLARGSRALSAYMRQHMGDLLPRLSQFLIMSFDLLSDFGIDHIVTVIFL